VALDAGSAFRTEVGDVGNALFLVDDQILDDCADPRPAPETRDAPAVLR